MPEKLEELVALGSVLRVPLRGRRVRGWVTRIYEGEATPNLQPIASVSGKGPVFDEESLAAARAVAERDIHPLSAYLNLMTPARLGRRGATPAERVPVEKPGFSKRLLRLSASDDPVAKYAEIIDESLSLNCSVILTIPEVREGPALVDALVERYPDDAAVVHSSLDEKERSAALWEASMGKRRLVIGGRAAIFSNPKSLGAIIIHQENDPSYKEQRAPYYDTRRVAVARGRESDAAVVLASTVPSLSAMAWLDDSWVVDEPDRAPERARWPVVELLESAKIGIPRRCIAAIIEARNAGGRSMLLLPRSKASRSGPGPVEVERFVRRVVPDAKVMRADRQALSESSVSLQDILASDVVIATESALQEVQHPVFAAVMAISADAFWSRPSGRASEDAFAILWSLASLTISAASRAKGRMLIETQAPEHHVVQAITRGDHAHFSRRELAQRKLNGAPPFTTLVRLQIGGPVPGDVLAALGALPDTDVLGPSDTGNLGSEILLKIADYPTALPSLGTIVKTSEVRILAEVDPRQW